MISVLIYIQTYDVLEDDLSVIINLPVVPLVGETFFLSNETQERLIEVAKGSEDLKKLLTPEYLSGNGELDLSGCIYVSHRYFREDDPQVVLTLSNKMER